MGLPETFQRPEKAGFRTLKTVKNHAKTPKNHLKTRPGTLESAESRKSNNSTLADAMRIVLWRGRAIHGGRFEVDSRG